MTIITPAARTSLGSVVAGVAVVAVVAVVAWRGEGQPAQEAQTRGHVDAAGDFVGVGLANAKGDDVKARRDRSEHLARLEASDELSRQLAGAVLEDGRSVAGAVGTARVDDIVKAARVVDITRYVSDGTVEVTGRLPRWRVDAALAPLRLR